MKEEGKVNKKIFGLDGWDFLQIILIALKSVGILNVSWWWVVLMWMGILMVELMVRYVGCLKKERDEEIGARIE